MLPLIDTKHKIIYFWSPKCGCTTLKMFYAAMNDYGIDNPRLIHLSIDPQQEDLLKQNIDFSGYKKIMLIREPFSRVVSSFLAIVAPFIPHLLTLSQEADIFEYISSFLYVPAWKPKDIPLAVKEAMMNFRTCSSFKNYVKLINAVDVDLLEHHLSPQFCAFHTSLFPSILHMRFNKLARVDNLSAELTAIAQSFGKTIPITRSNATSYDSNIQYEGLCSASIHVYHQKHGMVYPGWSRFYDLETFEIVKRIFAKDIALYSLSSSNNSVETINSFISTILWTTPSACKRVIDTNIKIKSEIEKSSVSSHLDSFVGRPCPTSAVEKAGQLLFAPAIPVKQSYAMLSR